MIIEEREYTIIPGRLQDYVSSYAAEGLAIQEPILGNLVGYFTTDFSDLNRVVHMWGYRDLEDREERRQRLSCDERWRAYVAKMVPLIVAMKSRVLMPTAFSPIR